MKKEKIEVKHGATPAPAPRLSMRSDKILVTGISQNFGATGMSQSASSSGIGAGGLKASTITARMMNFVNFIEEHKQDIDKRALEDH